MVTSLSNTIPSYSKEQRRRIKLLNHRLSIPDLVCEDRGYWLSGDGRSILSYRQDSYGYFLPESRLRLSSSMVELLNNLLPS